MTLRAEAITFGYRRGKPALRDVSASFEPGAITAILGPNGAGKSTLLRLLLGFVRPWKGRATLDSADIASLSPRARAARLAYVAQRPVVTGAFTARQVVALGRYALAPDPRVVERALAAMRCTDRADDPFDTLSAGLQQRVALARALAQLNWPPEVRPDPTLAASQPVLPTLGRALLADEPVSAMDPRHLAESMSVLRDLAATGVTVVLVLHDLTLARRAADRALVLTPDGAAAAEGPVTECLSPDLLARVFQTRFDLLDGPGGPAIIPSLIPGAPAPP